jgi:hypothetical protein
MKRIVPQTCFLQVTFSHRLIFYFRLLYEVTETFFPFRISFTALKSFTDFLHSHRHMKCTTYGNEALICLRLQTHTRTSETLNASKFRGEGYYDDHILSTILAARCLILFICFPSLNTLFFGQSSPLTRAYKMRVFFCFGSWKGRPAEIVWTVKD